MRSHRLIILSLCGAVALTAACAVKDPPKAADALASVLPPAAAVPPAWKASGGVAGSVATSWAQTFNDQQLEALIEEGLANNLDLKIAAANIAVASGIVTQARALLYPQLALVGGAGLVGRDSV